MRLAGLGQTAAPRFLDVPRTPHAGARGSCQVLWQEGEPQQRGEPVPSPVVTARETESGLQPEPAGLEPRGRLEPPNAGSLTPDWP